MVKHVCRVLAVCPYPGLDNIIKEVAAEFPQLEMLYESGELDYGAEIARQYVNGEVDAIISRGGTARLISACVKIPTFDIGITANDLINTLSLARSTRSKKICLVGFHEVTRAARYLDRLLESPIPTYVTKTAEENIALMKKLKEDNVELIIGDATSVRFARMEGINNIMISSGEDSVRQCLTTLLTLFEMQDDCRELQALQRNILKNLEVTYFVVAKDLSVLHSQINSQDLQKIASSLMQEITAASAEKFLCGKIQERTVFTHGEHGWILEIKQDLFREEPVLIIVWHKYHQVSEQLKTILHDLSGATYPFQVESLQATDPKMVQAMADCRAFAATKSPVLIAGERFTGRQALAHMLYNLSAFGKGGFYELDAGAFSRENLAELFDDPHSLLNSLSLTLIVRNLQYSDPELCQLFFAYLHDSSFCRRSRLICIFEPAAAPLREEQLKLTRYILSSLQALLITVPPLRERQGDLMFLAAIALGEACGLCGKDCAGFTPDAKEFILQEPWYGNLHELRGIIRQVTTSLNQEYIDAPALQAAAEKWQTLYAPRSAVPSADLLQGTLEEIEQRIIAAVLTEENGNKTKVTKRLGISRNTLWRKLKAMSDDGDPAA